MEGKFGGGTVQQIVDRRENESAIRNLAPGPQLAWMFKII